MAFRGVMNTAGPCTNPDVGAGRAAGWLNARILSNSQDASGTEGWPQQYCSQTEHLMPYAWLRIYWCPPAGGRCSLGERACSASTWHQHITSGEGCSLESIARPLRGIRIIGVCLRARLEAPYNKVRPTVQRDLFGVPNANP